MLFGCLAMSSRLQKRKDHVIIRITLNPKSEIGIPTVLWYICTLTAAACCICSMNVERESPHHKHFYKCLYRVYISNLTFKIAVVLIASFVPFFLPIHSHSRPKERRTEMKSSSTDDHHRVPFD